MEDTCYYSLSLWCVVLRLRMEPCFEVGEEGTAIKLD